MMKTAVQATSIHAYHANAAILSESREMVAREILRLTRAGHPAYISLVAENLDVDKSGVSARFNDLAHLEEGFILDGRRWKMERLKNKVFDPKSGKSGQWVNAWALIPYTSPAGVGEQIKMF